MVDIYVKNLAEPYAGIRLTFEPNELEIANSHPPLSA